MATNYVGTRWYRAPELLRPDDVENDCFFEGSCFYTKAIDVFSMACVAAELHRCAPLFLSKDESEQLRLIEELLLETKPPVGGSDVSRHDVSETIVENRLKDAIPTNDPRALSLIRDCLELCPERRPNADEVLCHGYFEREYHVATFGGENDENPAHARFSPANSTRPPASDVLPDQTHMEDPRKHMSPSAAPTTGIITPTPVDWATINFESTNPPKEKERVGRPFLNNSEGINALGMNRTPPFHTPKRQKLRPSQIFNID
jgi:serine/threonine protein kinase